MDIKYTIGVIKIQLDCACKVIDLPAILKIVGLNQDPSGCNGAQERSPLEPNCKL